MRRARASGSAVWFGAADDADLPEDERRPGLDRRPPLEELRRLVALPAVRRRVDAEVCDEAVLGRDAREHLGGEALRTRARRIASCDGSTKTPGWP